MIIKLFGQFLLATTAIQLLPVDAAFFEWQAGVGNESYELVSQNTSLPQSEARFITPRKIDTDSFGIVTTAQSAIVVDRDSKAVLFEKQANSIRSIGSVTKLLTALVFLESKPDLEQIVTLDPTRDYVIGGIVYLGYYDGVLLHDVLRASLIGSDNTATQSLVYFSGLTQIEFVARMNKMAQEFGMNSSQFTDPTGVDATNVSTARDLVLLLAEADVNEIIADIMGHSQVRITQSSGYSVSVANTNGLLETFVNQGDYAVLGGKTGYLPQAGYVLASTIEYQGSAVHVIVLGAESKEARVAEVKGLAYWAFKTYDWQ